MSKDNIILALDGMSRSDARDLAQKVGDKVYALKIHDLYDGLGPLAFSYVEGFGAKVWVDFKLHDIPQTVERRAKALVSNGADIITVHAAGGVEMMQAALQSGATIYAITVLTSISEEQAKLMYGQSLQSAVMYFADLALDAGVHGIVCSPLEVDMLSSHGKFNVLEFITPGVRSAGVAVNDQKRVDTPERALQNGATRLVIGRQVTNADHPLLALELLTEEIEGIQQREVVRV